MYALRSYFWTFYVAGLVAMAWFISEAVSDLTAASGPALPEIATAYDGASPPDLPRRASGRWLTAPPEPVKPPVGVPPGLPVEPPSKPVEYAPQRTELPVELMGTIVVQGDPAVRFATLLINGAASMTVARGSIILGGAEVVAVRPRVIFLRQGDTLSYAELWDGTVRPRAIAKASPRPLTQSKAPTRTAAWSRPRPDAAPIGIKSDGKNSWMIDKQFLEETINNPSQEMMRARVVPRYVKGRMNGVKLHGVGARSLYRRIGLRSGDVITSVNGQAIDRPNALMALYNELASARSFRLDVMRRGQPVQLTYQVQ